jgi:hypothetical protein
MLPPNIRLCSGWNDPMMSMSVAASALLDVPLHTRNTKHHSYRNAGTYRHARGSICLAGRASAQSNQHNTKALLASALLDVPLYRISNTTQKPCCHLPC